MNKPHAFISVATTAYFVPTSFPSNHHQLRHHSTYKSLFAPPSSRDATRYAQYHRLKIVASSTRASGKRNSSKPKHDPVELGFADDYNRDYYDEIKEEYKDHPLVTIYSRDDYELDNHDADWLSNDMRGRDPQKLREVTASRPPPDGLSFAPLLHTDMHSEDEINNFNERAQTYDPTTGIPWQDVPHDMHRYPDCEFSDLRHDDNEYDMDHVPDDLPFEPMKRLNISPEEEMEALRLALNELDYLDSIDNSFEHSGIDANVSHPSTEEFQRWSHAAEVRGGHATEHESYALPPVTPKQEALPKPPLAQVPNQYSELLHSHGGSWHGEMQVLLLKWEKSIVSVAKREIYQVESYIDLDEKGIRWETGLITEPLEEADEEIIEHCSTVSFAWKHHEEDLSPERAVFPGGSYVTQRSPTSTLSTQPLSLGTSAISHVAQGSKGVLEFASMANHGVEAERTRVILCANDSMDGRISKRKRVHDPRAAYSWTHLITIREKRVESGSGGVIDAEQSMGTMAIVQNGSWSGKGITLQPLFPRAASMYVESMVRWTGRDNILPSDVEWNKVPDFSKVEEDTGRAASNNRGSNRAHRSKRIRAAANHDATRLASCTMLCEERIGDEPTTTHAWSTRNNSYVAISPRLGKFVTDYFAIALSETHVLTAPFRKALPPHQNTVSLIEQCGEHRRRLVVCRGADNHIVGAAHLDESQQSTQ